MTLSFSENRDDRFTVHLSLLAEISPHFKWKLGQTAIYLWCGRRESVVVSGYVVSLVDDHLLCRYQVTTVKSLRQLADGETDYPDIFEIDESELIADKSPSRIEAISSSLHLSNSEVA